MPDHDSATHRLRDFWFRVDLRSAGLLRILLAMILIWHWFDRWHFIDLLFSAQGVLPGRLLPQLTGPLAWLSPLCWPVVDRSPLLIRSFFLLALGCYVAFLVGYRTRLFGFLSLAAVASFAQRNPYCLIGADFVMASLLLWGQFLPLGQRFSVDSLWTALAQRPRLRGEPWAGEPNAPTIPLPRTSGLLIAAFGIVLNLGLIYVFTALHKTVPMLWGESASWKDGSAIWYVWHMEQSLYPLALWFRQLPVWCIKGLTWGTLVIEFAALPMFLIRFGQPWARRIILVLLIGLHVGIAVTVDAGLFSYTMLAGFSILLMAADWEVLRRLLANFSHPATVYYDDNCGICTRTCEAVATWDRFSRLTFIGSSDRAAWQHSIPEGLVEKTIVVFDSQGRMTIKAAGAATIFAALPLPWHIFRIMAWPGLRWISDRAYDAFARNRHRVSSGLKLTACGVPGVADKANRNHEHEGPAWPMPEEGVAVASAAHPDVSRASGRWLCEPVNLLAGVVLLSVLAGNWGENGDPLWQMARGRSRVDVQQSQRGGWRKWAIENPVVHWPAAIQCWNMFSPDAPGFDNWWVADAETADGRHIDLLARRRDEQDKAVLYFDQPRCTDGWRGWPVLESTWGSYLKHALVSEAGDRLPKATIVLGEFCRYLTQQYNAAVPPQARVTKVRLVNVHLLTAPLTQSATFVPPSDPLFGVLQGTYDAASGSFEPRWDFDKESGQLRTTIVCWHPPRADGTTQIKWIGKRIMATPQVRRQMPDYAWYYDGLFRSWHADGKPLSEGTFACGQRIGLWTHWNEDGVRQQGSYRDNQRDGKWTFLSPDGRLAEGTYIGGKQSGEWVRYYAPRELPAAARAAAKDPARAAVFERMQMVDGEHHGPAQSLYPNGAIRSSGMISHNKQTGVWEEFYPSGRLQALGPYQDNFKHGRWMIWYDLGESESTPLAEGEFRQGKRHGRWTEWSLSGAKRTTMFEDGKPK